MALGQKETELMGVPGSASW